jgi:16S rRNA processing protein RimM
MAKLFVVAVAGAPFGLTGRLKIESLSGEEAHLLGLKKAVLRKNGTETPYVVEEVFPSPLSVKFAGIDSPEAAKPLKGAEILAPREQAAPLKEGEFYIEDLRGLQVVAGGTTIGTIHDVIEGGGGFLIEIEIEKEDNSREKRLIPFRDEFFGTIDLAAGKTELRETWIIA